MRVTVDEAGKQHSLDLGHVRVRRGFRQLPVVPHRLDPPVVADQDGCPVEHLKLAHLGAAPRPHGASTGHDL